MNDYSVIEFTLHGGRSSNEFIQAQGCVHFKGKLKIDVNDVTEDQYLLITYKCYSGEFTDFEFSSLQGCKIPKLEYTYNSLIVAIVYVISFFFKIIFELT